MYYLWKEQYPKEEQRSEWGSKEMSRIISTPEELGEKARNRS